MYWCGRVEACGSSLMWCGLNFSTGWCNMQLISVEKDWKHVLKIFISPEWIYPVAKQTENNKLLMQKVVTLNTCCDIACLTFQLPHITTESFQSHRRQPTTGSFRSFQRLKERNKPSVGWKSFAFHKLVWGHFHVEWRSRSLISSENVNNQKYAWIILLKMTFLDLPR